MIKTISSRLTAHFRVDGSHLDRYVARRAVIIKSLCEDLILHDRVIIPTTDYFTAIGLLRIIGERSLTTLLEQERLKFVRTKRIFGFARGKDRDGGLLVLADPNNRRPQDAPIESAVEAAMTHHASFDDRKKFHTLIVRNSSEVETTDILAKVTSEAINDFKASKYWKPNYEFPKPDLVALPGVSKMQVRVAGAESNPKTQAVDALLSLAVYNIDLFLAHRFECDAVSSFAPIGDLIDLKSARTGNHTKAAWELFEVNGVPDLSDADLTNSTNFDSFNKLITGKNADDFRQWFHSLKSYDRTVILKEYIGLLRQTPWITQTQGKVFRFVTTTGLGFIPIVGPILGAVTGALDTFVVDRLVQRKSPKFFIDDLNQVAGSLRNRPS